MYMKVKVTYGTIVLNKYADLPFRNFSFYLSALVFYFSDYTVYNIGVFLNISKKNKFAPKNKFIIPKISIKTSNAVRAVSISASIKIKSGISKS